MGWGNESFASCCTHARGTLLHSGLATQGIGETGLFSPFSPRVSSHRTCEEPKTSWLQAERGRREQKWTEAPMSPPGAANPSRTAGMNSAEDTAKPHERCTCLSPILLTNVGGVTLPSRWCNGTCTHQDPKMGSERYPRPRRSSAAGAGWGLHKASVSHVPQHSGEGARPIPPHPYTQ